MHISFNHCQNILNTLPVGYYLGHRVAVNLSEGGTETYLNLEDESITISYKMIADAFTRTPEIDDPEPLIRGLLYHEISHCLLTSRELPWIERNLGNNMYMCQFGYAKIWPNIKPYIHDLINIMEDERIETILAHYYLNVDFKKNLYIINGVTDPAKVAAAATTPLNKFYCAVRYHVGPQEVIDSIKQCIIKYYDLAHNSEARAWSLYAIDIIGIAAMFFKNNGNAVAPQQQSDGTQSQTGAQPQNNPQQQNDVQQQDNNFTEEVLSKLGGIDAVVSKIKQIFKERSTNKEALAIEDRLNRIITIATKKHGQSSGASPAYCGKINPRLCQNNDYKWWLKRSNTDANKRYTKVHFNLFCDNSGSFSMSQSIMNGLLLALKHLEETNKDFTFSVVHLGDGDTLETKETMYLDTSEGSYFYSTIFDTYKKLQQPNVMNLNIVVIDGEMESLGKNGFNAFNHENCIIVTDTTNQKYISAKHKAKCTFLNRYYAETFIDIVLNKIQACLV